MAIIPAKASGRSCLLRTNSLIVECGVVSEVHTKQIIIIIWRGGDQISFWPNVVHQLHSLPCDSSAHGRIAQLNTIAYVDVLPLRTQWRAQMLPTSFTHTRLQTSSVSTQRTAHTKRTEAHTFRNIVGASCEISKRAMNACPEHRQIVEGNYAPFHSRRSLVVVFWLNRWNWATISHPNEFAAKTIPRPKRKAHKESMTNPIGMGKTIDAHQTHQSLG